MNYIQIERLIKEYGSGDAVFRAVKGISFTIPRGDFAAIMGESGSGKSTLLTMMGALNSPTSGTYMVEDMDVYALGQDQRAEFRREFLGFIFQNFHLIPYLTVLENVMLPLTTSKIKKGIKRAMAEKALERVSLGGKGARLPGEISGGEQERVAIARAVVNEPELLLADEPTGNLDTKNSRAVTELFKTLNGDGMTIVMVTHSQESARYARRILRISDGLLVEDRPAVNKVERVFDRTVWSEDPACIKVASRG